MCRVPFLSRQSAQFLRVNFVRTFPLLVECHLHSALSRASRRGLPPTRPFHRAARALFGRDDESALVLALALALAGRLLGESRGAARVRLSIASAARVELREPSAPGRLVSPRRSRIASVRCCDSSSALMLW